MATETNNKQDYTLTYPDVQRILNRSRRSIQALVSDGKLHKEMITGPDGERAYFSESEVNKLSRELGVNGQGEKPEERLAQYEGGFSMLAPQVQRMQETIDEQQEQIQELATEKGNLQGQLAKTEELLKSKDDEIANRSERSEKLEQERAELERTKIQLESTLQHERFKAKVIHLVYAAAALLIAAALVVLSPFLADFVTQFLAP